MIKKSLVAMIAATALTLPAVSHAVPSPIYSNWVWSWTGCGGISGAFNTCASVTSEYASNTGYLRFTVTNLGDKLSNVVQPFAAPSVFTQLGFYGFQAGCSGNGDNVTCGSSFPMSYANAGSGTWSLDNNLSEIKSLTGLGDYTRGINASGNDGLTVGKSVQIIFSGVATTQDANSIAFGLHGQVGPNGCSTKFSVTRSGTATPAYTANGVVNANTVGCGYKDGGFVTTQSTVPEPSTYALMAAGLAALGVVARRRRQA